MVKRDMKERGKELAPIRAEVYAEFEKDPHLNLPELAERFSVSKSTVYSWKKRWDKKRKRGAKAERQSQSLSPVAITWEQIIAVIPDTLVLGTYLVDGFMEKLKRLGETVETKNQEIEKITKQLEMVTSDRGKITQRYNELLRRVRSSAEIGEVRKQLLTG